MGEPLQQLNISLPISLIAFVDRRAAQHDHTRSGEIRHIIADAKRCEAPLEGIFPAALAPALPNIKARPRARVLAQRP
jgi:hypothetical protein